MNLALCTNTAIHDRKLFLSFLGFCHALKEHGSTKRAFLLCFVHSVFIMKGYLGI